MERPSVWQKLEMYILRRWHCIIHQWLLYCPAGSQCVLCSKIEGVGCRERLKNLTFTWLMWGKHLLLIHLISDISIGVKWLHLWPEASFKWRTPVEITLYSNAVMCMRHWVNQTINPFGFLQISRLSSLLTGFVWLANYCFFSTTTICITLAAEVYRKRYF